MFGFVSRHRNRRTDIQNGSGKSDNERDASESKCHQFDCKFHCLIDGEVVDATFCIPSRENEAMYMFIGAPRAKNLAKRNRKFLQS